ncbi:MAG TPA: hypothetical protein PKC28_04170, partial [Bdellovibrionales bacterium]|nr:hypothetical protein [Bdellovibrionales bacterium]
LLLRARALKTLGAVFALIAFALSAQTVRFVPWSSLLLLICIKPYAELTRVRLDRPWLRRGIAILLFAVAAKNLTFGYMSSSGQRLPRLGLDPKFFPSTTIEFLKQRPIPGRLYNSHDFGSALVWNGIRPIFHHGFVTDMQFYKGDVMGALGTRERFLELADKYGWTMLLVDKFNGYREMHRILSPIPEWKIVAEDEAAYLIYKMPDPPHAR